MGLLALEQEFRYFEIRHKLTLLKAMLVRYYQDLKDTNTKCLSSEVRNKTADELAQKELNDLIISDNFPQKFNSLYNNA